MVINSIASKCDWVAVKSTNDDTVLRAVCPYEGAQNSRCETVVQVSAADMLDMGIKRFATEEGFLRRCHGHDPRHPVYTWAPRSDHGGALAPVR